MTDEEARAALQRLIDRNGGDYSGLSRLLGRNPAYVQQYLRRGTPRRLAERDRQLLARFFGVDEAELGGPKVSAAANGGLVTVRRLDVGLAAGAGRTGGGEEARGHIAFDPAWLRQMTGSDAASLTLLRVEGDSMEPTLAHGDEVLVDGGSAGRRLRDGIYAIRIEDMLLVKRLAFNPAARRVSIRSDNPAYPAWPDCDPDEIDLLGRIVWAGKRIG